ncbi:MAG: DUF1294 domain-containing protein [Acidimicrobiales bacterium]|nr:DUF1294 domain-containing protein [Hyphomonadaceae bacterium]RZV43440.1 MAG: DUF1294 domain-containing protein [Acidimicrobiales bacterium]
MELLIICAIVLATVPAMLFQSISNLTIRWVLLGGLFAIAVGTLLALPLIEQGEFILGSSTLTKVHAIPIAIGFLIVLNLLVVPSMYYLDKRRAIINHNARDKKKMASRVPEFSMHFLTALGGAIGAFTSQQLFRHKRSKKSFQMIFFITLLSSMIIYYVLWVAVSPDFARIDAWMENSGFK